MAQPEKRENSVLFSLRELRQIEENRVQEEEQAVRSAEEQKVRAKENAERAAREAEEARVRAEREAQLEIERAREGVRYFRAADGLGLAYMSLPDGPYPFVPATRALLDRVGQSFVAARDGWARLLDDAR